MFNLLVTIELNLCFEFGVDSFCWMLSLSICGVRPELRGESELKIILETKTNLDGSLLGYMCSFLRLQKHDKFSS